MGQWVKVDPSAQGPDAIPESEFKSDEDMYGGVGGALKAGALGVARGLTLSGSDALLTKSGLMKPETIKGLEEENPMASLTGEAASFLAPVGAAGLIGKAGKAVTGGVEALQLVKKASDVTRAGKILGATADIGAHALGSAVEGAIYAGVGQSLHEYALGDPSLNGEKVLANFGMGALYGAGAGAMIKGVAIGLPPSIEAAKGGISKLRDIAIGGEEGSGGLFSKVTGAVGMNKWSEAMANRFNTLDKSGQEGMVKEFTNALKEMHGNVSTGLKNLNSDIRPQEVDALFESVDPKKAFGFKNQFTSELQAAVSTMQLKPKQFSGAIESRAQDILEGIAQEGDVSARKAFDLMVDAKKKLGQMASEKSQDINVKNSVRLIQDVFGNLREGLRSPEVFGDIGARLAEHDDINAKWMSEVISPRGQTEFQKVFGKVTNGKWAPDQTKVERFFKKGNTITGMQQQEVLQNYLDFAGELPTHLEETYKNIPNSRFDKEALANIIDNKGKTIQEAHEKYVESIGKQKTGLGSKDMAASALSIMHPAVGAAFEAYNIITNPIEYASKLANLERTIGKVTSKVESGASQIFDPAMSKVLRTAPAVVRKEIDRHEYDKNTENLKQLDANAEHFVDAMNDSTKSFSEHAPDTATQMNLTSTRAVQFLASKIPVQAQLSPFDPKTEPSTTQMSQFNRYYNTINDPTSILNEVARGTITPEHVEAMQMVYPQLYQQMKASVLDKAAKALAQKQVVPYRTKEMLSLFLGAPLESSFLPQNVLRNQMIMNRKSTPMGQQPQKKVPASAKLGMSERTGLSGSKIDA